MFHSILLRGASAGALAFALGSSSVFAQEALPTIDINGEQGRMTEGARSSGRDDSGGTIGYAAPKVSSALKTDLPLLVH
ncbi:hypothetical+protein [Methylocapsa aurea]|uniref:hypothetical protein n=1 Tax=Methylocapsa aurea TaxID=663610 RepID=UPI003D18E8C5